MSEVGEKLQEVEISYRHALEHATDAFYILDAQGGVQFMNSAALALCGKSWELLRGRKLDEAYPPDLKDQCLNLFSRVCQTKEKEFFRALRRLPDGGERDHLIAFLPQRNEQGDLVQVLSLIKWNEGAGAQACPTGLSLHEDAEEWLKSSLRQSEQRLRMACQAARVCTWEWNRGQHFARASHDLFSWLGIPCPPDERITLNCLLGSVHPEDKGRVVEAARDASRRHGSMNSEFRLVHPDGSERWVASYSQPILNSEGRIESLLGLIQDISERKKHEESLRLLNETLERKVAERTSEVLRQAVQLRALTAELTKTEQKERKRLAALLHDHVQQLLVATSMQIDLARRCKDPEEIQSLLDSAKDILDEAVQDLRSLSVELCPPILYYSGLPAALTWLAKRLEHLHHFRVSATVDERANPALEEVRFMLFECARELLLNSMKHSGSTQARVDLSLTPDDWIQIEVSDQGRGFDASQLLAQGSRLSGFGLFSIEQRLAYLGGQIQLESSPGQGARITLVVPAALQAQRLSQGWT